MKGSFVPVIVLVCVVAAIAAVNGDWLIAAVFLVMALAFARVQAIAQRRR